jgi:two-component system response regulator (stage 0 sporulation protein A)
MNIKTKTENILLELGVPAHVKGFSHLRDAITLCAADETIIHSVTTRLYPEVAERWGGTGSQTERAIRHGIELAFDSNTKDAWIKYFSRSIGKPTNAEFIATVAVYVTHEEDSNENN